MAAPMKQNFIDNSIERMSRAYMETIEKFAVSLGATAENAHEFKILSHDGEGGIKSFLFRNGAEVGTILAVFEVTDKLTFRVTCTPTLPIDSDV